MLKLSLKAVISEDSLRSCVVDIDELNLIPETCTSIAEGTVINIRYYDAWTSRARAARK